MSYTFVRVINNNAIVGADKNGQDVVLLGKGIGLRCIKKRNYIIPAHLIERVFVIEKKVNENYLEELLKSIPSAYIDMVNRIMTMACELLHYDFKDQLFLTLLEHIEFSKKRFDEHLTIENPLLNEIKQFYPKEYDAAQKVVNVINKELDVSFDENEVSFIAFHFINAMSTLSQSTNKKITSIMKSLTDIVQQYFNIKIDDTSTYYIRFITHLKYFLSRVFNDKDEAKEYYERVENKFYEMIKEKYTCEWDCALKIKDYLKKTCNVDASNEELGYLTMHIASMLLKQKK